jgi:hypothetical protein
MRGFGEIAERLRRSSVHVFNGAARSHGSGIPQFLRDDLKRVREAVVRLAAPVEAAA